MIGLGTVRAWGWVLVRWLVYVYVVFIVDWIILGMYTLRG